MELNKTESVEQFIDHVEFYFGVNGARSGFADLLESYSRWLEKHGYMDSDWYTEGNTVEEFLDEMKEKK